MNRRYRTIKVSDLELRAHEGDGPPRITGHAAVFDVETTIGSFFREVIKPGAFKRAIAENQDVRALINHEVTPVLARTKSGTLQLSEDDIGLAVSFTVSDSQVGIVESVERKDIDQMSFSFIPTVETRIEQDGEPLPLFEVRDSDLFDVSLVTFPQYTTTDAQVARLQFRSRGDEEAYREYAAERERAHDELERIKRTTANMRTADLNQIGGRL